MTTSLNCEATRSCGEIFHLQDFLAGYSVARCGANEDLKKLIEQTKPVIRASDRAEYTEESGKPTASVSLLVMRALHA